MPYFRRKIVGVAAKGRYRDSQTKRSRSRGPGYEKRLLIQFPHGSVIQGAMEQGIRGKMLTFAIRFLENRTYELVIGTKRHRNRRMKPEFRKGQLSRLRYLIC